MADRSDESVKSLEAIRDKLYHEQPDCMSTVEAIIDFLVHEFCPHEWETKFSTGSPVEPTERFQVCKKCGEEQQ